MNAVDPVERDLIAHFRSQGEQAPRQDGWGAVLTRVHRREVRRQRRRAATTVLAMLAVVGTVASLASRSSSDGSDVVAGPAAGQETRLPHLLLDLPGYELDYASDHYEGTGQENEPRRSGPLRLSVLTEPGRGYDGRVLFVTTAAPGSGYGVGDRSPAARGVRVGGRDAWIMRYSALPVTSLGWYTPDGGAVHLVGVRFDEDALVAAARDLLPAADGSLSWGAGPPEGFTEQRTVEVPLDARSTAEVRYVRGDGLLTLRVQDGGQAVLDDLVRDRAAASAEIGETTVDGVAAVLVRYDAEDRLSLMWQIRPGVVAELAARRSATQDAVEAARSITEIDEAAWQAVLAPFSVPAGEPPVVLDDLTRSMCDARNQWLAAVDGAGRYAAAETLGRLRLQAIARGADKVSDIVVVMDRLIAAMAAGDAATVRSTPAGEACG